MEIFMQTTDAARTITLKLETDHTILGIVIRLEGSKKLEPLTESESESPSLTVEFDGEEQYAHWMF